MNKKMDFKAFEEGGMDEFLRKTVEGHRVDPNPGLWKGISRKLLWRELAHFNFTNISSRFWITGAAGVLILATAFYFMLPDRQTVVPAATIAVNTPGMDGTAVRNVIPSTSTPHQKGNQPAAGSDNLINHSKQIAKARQPSGTMTGTMTGKSTGTTTRKSTGTNNPMSNEILAYAANIPNRTSNSPDYVAFQNEEPSPAILVESTENATLAGLIIITPLVPVEAFVVLVNPDADTIITINTASGISRFLVTKPAATQFFSVNLGVVPEMSFYSMPETYSKMNVWLNGGLSYHFSRFSISTGAGLGYIYDKSKYRVEYKSNDSIGFYSSVVSYTVGNSNEIIYTTVNKVIYDSLMHQNDYRTLNRYAYLQVPLLLGYRLVESNRVSLTFQVGPAVSFLLGTRRSSPEIDYGNARVIRVDDNTPSRVHTNWQVMGNLLLELRMNRQISLYAEPSCKYYLNPLVEQENVSFKAPWSVGLGVGIQFNFAPKMKKP
jgi:hypothetical protein